MTDLHPSSPERSDGPNTEVAAGLRELAAFLESHPELPCARWATVSLRAICDGQPARQTLEVVAAVLGPRASEQRTLGGDVEISALFGPVRVRATASVRELADCSPDQLPYEPIITDEPAPILNPEYGLKVIPRRRSDQELRELGAQVAFDILAESAPRRNGVVA